MAGNFFNSLLERQLTGRLGACAVAAAAARRWLYTSIFPHACRAWGQAGWFMGSRCCFGPLLAAPARNLASTTLA